MECGAQCVAAGSVLLMHMWLANNYKETPQLVQHSVTVYMYNIVYCTIYAGPVVYSGQLFGDGIYPVVMSYLGCGGWERGLTDCSHSMYGSFSCSRAAIVGLLCHDGNNIVYTVYCIDHRMLII